MKEKEVYQPEGNYYDKYNTKNPIAARLMKGYFSALDSLLGRISSEIKTILEAGCGEGEVSVHVYDYFVGKIALDAFDISEKVIEEAKAKTPGINFSVGNIYETNTGIHDLVLCCEVLEHMEHPGEVIQKLLEQTDRYLIVSVPREPIWRILNMCRGKYLKDLGNTPGHVQHWSSRRFIREFDGADCHLLAVKKPLPWTMLLIEKQAHANEG